MYKIISKRKFLFGKRTSTTNCNNAQVACEVLMSKFGISLTAQTINDNLHPKEFIIGGVKFISIKKA